MPASSTKKTKKAVAADPIVAAPVAAEPAAQPESSTKKTLKRKKDAADADTDVPSLPPSASKRAKKETADAAKTPATKIKAAAKTLKAPVAVVEPAAEPATPIAVDEKVVKKSKVKAAAASASAAVEEKEVSKTVKLKTRSSTAKDLADSISAASAATAVTTATATEPVAVAEPTKPVSILKKSKDTVAKKSTKTAVVVTKTEAAPAAAAPTSISRERKAPTAKAKKAKTEVKAKEPKAKKDSKKAEAEKEVEKDVEEKGDGSDAEDSDADHLHGFSTDDDDSSDEDAMDDEPSEFDMGKLPTIARDDTSVKLKLEKAKKEKSKDRGVIFLGRLPHGFYEDQMRGYFSQFGTVTRLRVSRNKKTGKSKHYGFVEFDSSAVAQIVAETMDNYLLMGHILRCKVVPWDKVHPELWVGANRKWRVVPVDRLTRAEHDKPRTEAEQNKATVRLLKRQQERKLKLAKAGIQYDIEGAGYKTPAAPTPVQS